MFSNREEAGHLLAKALTEYKNTDAIVLAIPRGALPIGALISKNLHLPLDIVLTKKIGHPSNKEYAIGAVSLGSKVLDESAKHISKSYLDDEIKRLQAILLEKSKMYYQDKKPLELDGKTLIVVDDGIATGNTILATVKLLAAKHPKQIIIATPVSSASALLKLQKSPEVTNIICLLQPHHFHAVGAFYKDFNPVSDEEAISLFHTNNKVS
ncbi:phosphoribosyltransferase [Mangrovimonas spongiae]|uniref:Phosphoribosyltransferase n=1 Tax=Mangrovimonas spongiae TaxID=2494697 RepID=A0A3R9NTF6_9FLAO|nr:phosphoribosyltransferase family protein [Mangrovimonas spongiae]RSK41406.1 phosphoribosyltransferase [Mangrovimonas spongiae]